MNFRTLTFSSLILISSVAFAKGDITGKLVNASTGEPMEFATIQLLTSSGKPLAIGGNSDEQGNFILKGVADGKYILRASSIGSVNQERPVTVKGEKVDLGVIRLAEDSKLLQEVVVEGIKSQMRFELDKKVFTVDANVTAGGLSASELLESIPSIEVDQDGEVSLRGNSSVTVWINGKESGLTADNRAQILEQIPAESIDRVEVITNPSAKYSPEGTAGIINIILKKDRKGGYYGSAELGGNSRGGANTSFNINYNRGKWDTFASIGFRMRHNTNGGSEMRRLFDDGTFTNSDGKRKNHGNNLFFRLGATYHFSDNDEAYVNGFGMFGHNWGKNITNYTSNVPGQWRENNDISRSRGDMRGAHVETGYTHRWSDTHNIDLTLSYNRWGGPSWNSYLEDILWDNGERNDKYQEQSMNIGSNSVEAKIDYTNQLTKWLKLEAGFNGNYSHENSPTTTWDGTSPEDMKINESLYNRFIYNNNISALYATLGGKFDKFSFSAGLRSESWQVRTRSLEYGQEKQDVPLYKKNMFALFPSLFLSYSLPHDNEVQINYTRRIRRPWGGQLNSFHNVSNPTNISYGNPELQPQYSNAFELNYIKSWTFHMISFSAYMRSAENMINRISFIDNDIMYSTFANVAESVNSGAEIVVKNSLFRSRLDLTSTVNLYNNHIKAWEYDVMSDNGNLVHLSNVKQNSFAWDARVMASVRLPWSLSFQASGRYASKRLTAQGSNQGGWSVDAGVRKIVGNWSFSLNCRDIFDSRKFRSTINGDGYTQTSKMWRGGRRLQLTIKYSFGNMKDKKDRSDGMGGGDEPMESGYGGMGGMQ